MRMGDSLQSAIRAILANKLRSALTMLGVVIGVGSVIAMIGIGQGTKQKSLENLEAMGTNVLTVFDWRRNADPGSKLDIRDVDALRSQVPTITGITGCVAERGTTVKYGSNNHRTTVTGAEPIIADIRNARKLAAGKWFDESDNDQARQVCVLGYVVYQELFGDEDAIGASIRVRGQNFEVLGVIEFKGGGSMMFNPDDQIYIPLRTAQQRLMGTKNFNQILIQANRVEFMKLTQTDVERILSQNHTSASGEQMFRVFNQGEQIEQLQQQQALLSGLLAGIASVSLLVGGIGIMNIMLVSVTERTREIGLRKAIGAKKESILVQFLLESVLMCLLGGALGIAAGWLATSFVAVKLNVPPIFSKEAVFAAFTFSALVGVFFGLYPALRASRLQPIEALRYE